MLILDLATINEVQLTLHFVRAKKFGHCKAKIIEDQEE